ncbi:GNAT family N-acetyltransferase [Staphylococcus ureilyticus]|uniref:GNAT family N-acetyltransferase n=1 Tax=Staphylococcus ureilyticus TaxID=94138 RepID=UPI0021CFC5DC|nr:GNAT family N-acetyltransferase [Staphylococcus ureilyticus]UXS59924.1 GNAT family N-acetyltransferase [Staphylococcus ureilyticus]
MIEKLISIDNAPIDLMLLADPSKKLILEYLENGECFIYKENNQIIGCYVLQEINTDKIELVNIAVLESKQGLGIGKKLLANAFEYAKEKGYKEMEIGTGNSSIGQIAFYQKMGFRMCEIDIGFFDRNYNEEISENGILCRDMIRFTKML